MIDHDLLEQAGKALAKAKIALMARPQCTFITTIVLSMHHVWDETIPTACTNGLEIRFNPAFFLSQSPEIRASILAHEGWHPALQHCGPDRMANRDPEIWNYAADYVANLLLKQDNFAIGAGWLLDDKYEGWGTEQVYKDLIANPPPPSKGGNGSSSGSGGLGRDIVTTPPDSSSPQNGETLPPSQQIHNMIMRANMMAQMAGDNPGKIPQEIQIYLESFLKPKLPYGTLLRRYVNGFAKVDHSWRKPNRRFFPEYHLPTLHSEHLESFAAAIDVSSSVRDAQFQQLVSEVKSALVVVKPQQMTLLQFNTQITRENKLRTLNELRQVKFIGRGGTDVCPVLEWAKTHKPKLLLIFSDGYFGLPSDLDPGMPVLWVIYNNPKFTAPFGRVIHFNL